MLKRQLEAQVRELSEENTKLRDKVAMAQARVDEAAEVVKELRRRLHDLGKALHHLR